MSSFVNIFKPPLEGCNPFGLNQESFIRTGKVVGGSLCTAVTVIGISKFSSEIAFGVLSVGLIGAGFVYYKNKNEMEEVNKLAEVVSREVGEIEKERKVFSEDFSSFKTDARKNWEETDSNFKNLATRINLVSEERFDITKETLTESQKLRRQTYQLIQDGGGSSEF